MDINELKNDLKSVLEKYQVSLGVHQVEGHICHFEEFVAVDNTGNVVATLNEEHGFISSSQLSK